MTVHYHYRLARNSHDTVKIVASLEYRRSLQANFAAAGAVRVQVRRASARGATIQKVTTIEEKSVTLLLTKYSICESISRGHTIACWRVCRVSAHLWLPVCLQWPAADSGSIRTVRAAFPKDACATELPSTSGHVSSSMDRSVER